VLLVLSRLSRIRLGRSSTERRLWWSNALLSFSGSYAIVYWAEQYVPSGLSAVLFATFPLFVSILAHFFLPGERLSPRSTAGILVGFLGVAVIFSEDLRKLGSPMVATASAVFLLSPIVSAVANVAVKKWGAGIHPFSLTAIPMGLAGAITGLAALTLERERDIRFDGVSVGALLYLAILGSAFTFTVYFWLMSHLPATRLALITYAIPVVAVLVGSIFLDEPLTSRVLLGAGCVVGGVAMAVRRREAQ
jgi:drug/metabolite transporter (DMT)-like permease